MAGWLSHEHPRAERAAVDGEIGVGGVVTGVAVCAECDVDCFACVHDAQVMPEMERVICRFAGGYASRYIAGIT